MPTPYNYYSRLGRDCFILNKSDKYNKCIKLKKSYSFSDNLFISDISQLLKARSKLEREEKEVFKHK